MISRTYINRRDDKVEYKVINIDELEAFPLREKRDYVLKMLEERLNKHYNPARPLVVVEVDSKYLVVDGNHRLDVLNKLGFKEVPCLIQEGNPYTLGVQSNEDENTYAPMDLFDWLDIIRELKNEANTVSYISEVLVWSESKVKRYSALLNNVVWETLNFAKQHQENRQTEKVWPQTFNFTETWFHDSGIYDLPLVEEKDNDGNIVNIRNRQIELLEWFLNSIKDKNKPPNNSKVQEMSERLKIKEKMIEYLDNNLLNQDIYQELRDNIENEVFSSFDKFKQRLNHENEKFEKEQQFKIFHGSVEDVGGEIEDNSIDLIITDPPYGEEYLYLWEKLGKMASRVLKDSGVLVTYSGQYHITEVLNSLSKYLDYFWTLAIVHTGTTHIINHRNVQSQWKPVLVFYKDELPKLKTFPDVIQGEKDKEYHVWSQSVSEASTLIGYLSYKGDTVLDPFAGSGTSLIASLKEDRKVIGIESEERNVNIIKGRVQNYDSG